jgi:hypothetical protein
MLWKDQIDLRWRPHLILLPILEFIARVQNKHNDKLVKGEYNLFLLTMFENIFIVFFFVIITYKRGSTKLVETHSKCKH